MPLSVNKVTLLGYVGQPQHSKEDTAAPLKFTLATSRNWRDQNQDVVEETTWHRVTVWRAPPQLAAKILPGARVYVEGRLHASEYDTPDGERRRSLEVVAPPRLVEVLAGPKKTPGTGKQPAPAARKPAPPPADPPPEGSEWTTADADDIPH